MKKLFQSSCIFQLASWDNSMKLFIYLWKSLANGEFYKAQLETSNKLN